MQKAKQYDWKDSNLALFGSDTEKQVKKDAAATEPAWKNAGQKIGVEIWRINKFKVEKWPKEDYGKFFNGDSYIVLNTYKEQDGDELLYDVHFWIGKYSTQDEYGTAAYKTVELDTLLDDKPIQHREVQSHESNLFKSYFSFFTIMKGGCDSGFRRVTPESYKKRLFHIVGERKKISVTEIPLKRGNLNSEDVFVIDCGLRIYQFNGETANKDEKFRATQYVNQLKSERMGKPRLDILEEKGISPSHTMYKLLPDGKSKEKSGPPENAPSMQRVSDCNGKIAIKEIMSGSIDRSQLDSNDVIIVSTSRSCFVWIGKGASIDERKNCMTFAHNFLQVQPNPFVPVTVLSEGKKSADFDAIW
ncbi:gelsolin-like protein 1 [Hydractinia symbiolongicarpus]|uniref:gelsolin-like protein 1 n=1 Tax=Hydractinia symbiolongicarpus TaxID=13093 RepID=UPI00254F64B6|nr:gelsolin-like protein 1 [Hydractinia symbiolongicarpus]XP_057306706.1 gelsolin-like protein 1 [Hydractinia symbiolongicarpus]